ncbi:hypothetical protein Ddye_014420 [Dipteronia dyeriana]|uniref:Uncharacterized protein n=1 Tax=Dipteronia dyeriana TaxID=168575 RepID=A0AAE0CKK8_9ROSI|nr:hypothetical protein Ddye_014420 [Dipteronia dyeriana]
MSNNKLIGKIPSGTQLQSFNALSFTGNELCGSPLKNCTVASVPTPMHENGEHEMDWFYVSMALGFVAMKPSMSAFLSLVFIELLAVATINVRVSAITPGCMYLPHAPIEQRPTENLCWRV